MAKEKFTVFYELETTQQAPAVWEEKEVKVKASGKEKNSGLWAGYPKSTGAEPKNSGPVCEESGKPAFTNRPMECRFVTIEAESAEEAAEALRVFYGQGLAASKCLGAKTSSLEEVSMIP